MKNHHYLLLVIFFSVLSIPASAGNLYKWVDENGNASYSDKVPPKDARRERETLSETGRTIAIKDAAKTGDEIQQFRKVQALQETKKQILENQLNHDTALLKTFQTETDIDAFTNSKLDMIDSHIAIAIGQSDNLRKQLIGQQKIAANFERRGKNIPKKTQTRITSAQTNFDENRNKIADLGQQKAYLVAKSMKDKSRFNTLHSLSAQTPEINDGTKPSLLLGELKCDINCEPLWERTINFIKTKGAHIIFTSENLVLTKKPSLSKDRGISLTKIHQEGKTKIMLDIRCIDSRIGKETCRNKQTTALVNEFNSLVPDQ
ncbi:MAG: DUF4124 domain-containing protein [Cycloclasticus sp.]|nr:MAG: DUF4124 domain-containing protein [Cycloclasticus sp.]